MSGENYHFSIDGKDESASDVLLVGLIFWLTTIMRK